MSKHYKLAAVYVVLSVLAFFGVCLRNIWAPGCSFECYDEDTVDIFGQRIVETWMVLGLIGSIVVVGLAVLWENLTRSKR